MILNKPVPGTITEAEARKLLMDEAMKRAVLLCRIRDSSRADLVVLHPRGV